MSPVLPAKLSPPVPDGAIARPRLFKALDKLKRRPITWVHAPAGAGKSTLLASYASARDHAALWYDVDAGDADPSALFHDLRVAAERLIEKPLSLPTPQPGSPDAQRAFAALFFRSLFAELPDKTMVVFDNYQNAVHAPAWNDAFHELCAAIDARIRVVTLSRVAPPVALARFCGNGELEVLDWSSLRLDQREIKSFIAGQDRELDSAVLLSLTDGWAVAVNLLAKSNASATALGRPVHNTRAGGSAAAELNNESIFRFLAGEIFDRLDPETREVLLALSLLPSFTASMASALTGQPNAVPILARLHGDQLLVERYGENSFRIHDLFRAFLLQHSRAARSEEAWNALVLRAAGVLDEDGQFQAAVEVLASIRAWSALAALIEKNAPMLAKQARFPTLASAIERVSFPERALRPWLDFWAAVATLGRPGGRALELAQKAFEDFKKRGDVAGMLLSWSLIVQAIVIAGEDFSQLGVWMKVLDELALEAPHPSIAVRVAIGEVLAYAFWEIGTARAVAAADRAIALVGRHGTAEDRVHLWGSALLVYFVGGRFERADDMRRLSRALVDEAGEQALPKLGYLHSDAILKLWRADFKSSVASVEEGLALAASSGVEAWTGSLIAIGFMSAIGRNDLATAERFLDTMGAMIAAGASRFARAQYAYGRGWLAFERGDVGSARRWMHDCATESEQLGFSFGRTQRIFAWVIFAGATGDARAIAEAIAELDAVTVPPCHAWLSTAAELAKTYARSCLGEDVSESLRATLIRMRYEGWMTLGYIGSRAVSRLMTLALEHDIEPELARKVLRAFEHKPGPEAVPISAWPWPIKIRTFGALELELDGKPLEFGRKTPGVPLALLKVLAASAEPVTTARMLSALWPGSGAASRASLDTAIYRLRKLLDNEEAIETSGGRIALASSLCWTDVRAFLVWCDRIALIDDSTNKDVLDRYERCVLELYRGPFGADDDPPPVLRARETLRRRFGQAIAALAKRWSSSGDEARARELVARALSHDEKAPIER